MIAGIEIIDDLCEPAEAVFGVFDVSDISKGLKISGKSVELARHDEIAKKSHFTGFGTVTS